MIFVKQLLPNGQLILIEAENDRDVVLNTILDTYKDCEQTRDMYLKCFDENQNMILIPKNARKYHPDTLEEII